MPIVTFDRQLACFCMPKTASSYVESVFAEERRGYRVLDQHDPAWFVLGENVKEHGMRDVPVHVGTVRDPWSWYGSLWAHAFHHPMQGGKSFPRRPFKAVLAYTKGETDLKSFVHGATHLDELDLPYEWLGAIWVPRPGGPKPGRGLWSWAVQYMFQDGRVERLIDGCRPAKGLRALGFGATLTPKNTSAGTYEKPELTDWSTRFDAEMVGWVNAADGEMRMRLGYHEPFEPSLKGVLIPW